MCSRSASVITRATQNASPNATSLAEKLPVPRGVRAYPDILEDDSAHAASPLPSSARPQPSWRLGDGDGVEGTYEHSTPEPLLPTVDPGITATEVTSGVPSVGVGMTCPNPLALSSNASGVGQFMVDRTYGDVQCDAVLAPSGEQRRALEFTETVRTVSLGQGQPSSKYPVCDAIPRKTCPSLSQVEEVEVAAGGPMLRKKRHILGATNIVPPAFITPRLTADAVAANKPIWILHPEHGDTAVAQGKSGISWKSKTKMGAMCANGEQWIFVHRVLKSNVQVLFGGNCDGVQTLESALPPSSGKHECIKWSSRH